MESNTKKVVTIGMLSAVAYIIMLFGRIPIVSFLKYDPKDVIITIGGFIFGPLTSFLISVLVSFVEMFTASDTGIIGCIMNMLSTCAFACTAAFFYKKKHTLKGGIIGLILGTILMTAIMLLWNYLITPLYLGTPREEVVKMLFPVFLPFNLLKGGLNTAITLLIYKPVVTALRKTSLAPVSSQELTKKSRSTGILFISALLLITCILYILVLKGVL